MRRITTFTLVTVACLASACTTLQTPPPTSAAAVGPLRPGSGLLKGYLARANLPDSLVLLPAPPIEGSAGYRADVAAFHQLASLQGTPRGALATSDADLHFPDADGTFACALGMPISQQATPQLNMLLRRSMTDAILATFKAKNKYNRTRPFVVFKVPTCTPTKDAFMAKNGSYPSGHSAIGWVWALELSEIAPWRTNELLQRGRAFGQSRGICGAHWESDVVAGRLIGAATVARLHADPVFRAQLAAARAEVEQARARGAEPAQGCAAEAATLATSSKLAP